MNSINSSNVRKILGIYWQHSKAYKKQLAIIYPTMVVTQLVEDFLQPLIVSFVITKLAQGDIAGLRQSNIGLIIAGIVVTEVIGHLLWNRVIIPIFWRTQEKIMTDLSMSTFDHLQQMSTDFFNNRFAGSLVNQANKFVSSFERLTDALTWNVFKLLVSVLATTIILAPKAPVLSLTILLISFLYIPITWRYRKRLVPLNKAWAVAESDRTGQLADTVSNILAVKSFSAEKREHDLMQTKVNAVFSHSMSTMKLTLRQELVTGSLQRSVNLAVIILSIILALNGSVNVGLIYLALNLSVGIMRRLWDLNNTFRAVTRVFGDAHDMADILAVGPGVADSRHRVETIADASVEFVNVDFRHEADQPLLFNRLSLRVKAGEKVGLVGTSGGGKTTITKLLLRFMDIQDGQILVGGADITTIPQSQLRQHIAYVPQEPLLFHRSLKENIAYGKPKADIKEVESIAKLAHADEFISKLPERYQTLVGERGVKLSGGQKQRVAIARAMLKDAPILVLDEATSALDSESEMLIQEALQRLMKGRTAIVIAHRLSTIQKLDRIIVLNDGQVIEQGSHSQLLKLGGSYATLWAHQSGGFIEE